MTTALVAVLSPLVLLAFNRDWVLTSEALIDPWHYVGFFRDYSNPDFGLGNYKVARLPWILSGVLAWRMLPPLAAAYALHLIYLCATTSATFIGVRRLFGQTALAAIVALCLGFYTHGHGSGGWDYHNTAAGAFYLMTFAVLAGPGAIAGRGGAMLLAGALAALTVHSNITLVNFLPVLTLVHFYLVWRAGSRLSVRAVAGRAAWALVGALAITAAMSLVNWSAGRDVVFFYDLVEKVVRYVGDPQQQAPFRMAPGWYYTATHLSLLIGVFCVGLVAAFARRTTDSDARLAVVLILQFLCMAVIWTGWQVAGQTALDWDYFAYALVPSCFIAIAGLLKLAWHEEYERRALLVALGTAAALALTLSGATDRLILPLHATFERFLMPAAAVIFSVAFAAAFIRPAALTAFVIAFALANRLAAPGAPGKYALTDPCKTEPAIYAAIVDGAGWLGSLDPTDRRVRTWFDVGERITITSSGCSVSLADIGESLTAMAYSGLLVDRGMPSEVSRGALEAVSDGESIVAAIAASPRARDVWDARLAQVGLTRRALASHSVHLGNAAFTIDAWTIEQLPPEGVVFGPPMLAIDNRPGARGNAGETVFNVVAPHARIARPPIAVTPQSGATWARLRIETSGLSPCRVLLQDAKLEKLVSAPCVSGTRYVLLPALTSAVTVSLENGSSHPAPPPARIELSLASR